MRLLAQLISSGFNLYTAYSIHTLTRGCWVSYDVCMKQMLTTKSLDAMPPATVKRYEVRDQKINGLHVRVSTTGAKVFYTMSARMVRADVSRSALTLWSPLPTPDAARWKSPVMSSWASSTRPPRSPRQRLRRRVR